MQEHDQQVEFSFKNYFVPLTTAKAITWIVIIGFIVYANMLFNGFVWDDLSQIVNSNSVHSLSGISSFFFGSRDINGNLIKISAIYYRPLMATIFTLVYVLFGPNSFFFHFLSLSIHIFISILLFLLFRRFFKQSIAFFLSVIFLIHPLNSETVDYISAYNDLFYTFFGLLSFNLLRHRTLSIKRTITISALLFLSLLSKESGFLFIPILLGYVFLYEKKYLYKILIGISCVVVTYLVLRTGFYTSESMDQVLGFSPYLHMSLLLHLINIPKIFYYYIINFFFPNHLAIAQHWSVGKITVLDFYIPFIVFLSFIILNVYLIFNAWRKKKYVHSSIFFSLWFWIGIVPYFQLFPLDMTVADRWFYFPMIGLLGLIGISLQNLPIRRKIYRDMAIAVAILCVLFLITRTIVRNTNWNNEYSLYTHDMAIAGSDFDLENQLGNVYFNEYNLREAKIHYLRSIALWDCSDAVNNLGYLEQTEGNLQVAEHEYISAVKCSGDYKYYGNLVVVLIKMNKLDTAQHYAKEAIQKYSNVAGLYFMLGIIDSKKSDQQDALYNLNTGYQLSHDPQIMNDYYQVENNKPIDLP